MKSRFSIMAFVLILVPLLLAGCGIPQSEYDQVVLERNALQSELDAVEAAKDTLQSELDEIQAVYPLRGFDTLSEFKDWITNHVQPETQYIDDAFLAACKVQEAGMSDGYLIGLDIDTFEGTEDVAVYISVFIGNELYWWFVEDVEAWGSYRLIK